MYDLLLEWIIEIEYDCIPKISPKMNIKSRWITFVVVVPVVECRSDQVTNSSCDVHGVAIPYAFRKGSEMRELPLIASLIFGQ